MDWSLRRQEPRRSVWPWLARGQWTSLASPTVCRPCCSSCCLARCVVLSLFSSLLVAVLFQFGCCRSVVLHCFCCRFIWCGCAHVIILLELRLPCFGWPCVAWPGCRASALGFCLTLFRGPDIILERRL